MPCVCDPRPCGLRIASWIDFRPLPLPLPPPFKPGYSHQPPGERGIPKPFKPRLGNTLSGTTFRLWRAAELPLNTQSRPKHPFLARRPYSNLNVHTGVNLRRLSFPSKCVHDWSFGVGAANVCSLTSGVRALSLGSNEMESHPLPTFT